MIGKERSLEYVAKQLNQILGIFVILCLLVGVLCFLDTKYSLNTETLNGHLISKNLEKVNFPVVEFNANNFAGKEESLGLIEILQEKLSFSLIPRRPDSEKMYLAVALDPQRPFQVLPFGETQFVSSIGQNIQFQNQKTPIYLTTFLDDQGKNVVEIGVHIQHQEQQITESQRFMLSELAIPLESPIEEEFSLLGKKAIKQLQHSLFLGEDRLFALYGGKDYADKATNIRMKIGDAFLHLAPGNLLYYVEGTWKRDIPQEPLLCPLIQVLENTENEVHLSFWDQKGQVYQTLTFPFFKEKEQEKAFVDAMQKMRRKTKDSISCKMGKQSFVLTKGDWLLYNQGYWKKIRTKQKFCDLLEGKEEGNLMIFEGIKKTKEGEYMEGIIFSPYRSKCYPFSRQITKRKPHKVKPKRRIKKI